MTTLYSNESDPGTKWKLTSGAGGLVLWVPAHGKPWWPRKLPANETDRPAKAAEIIGVAVDQLPQVLLDALRASGVNSAK